MYCPMFIHVFSVFIAVYKMFAKVRFLQTWHCSSNVNAMFTVYIHISCAKFHYICIVYDVVLFSEGVAERLNMIQILLTSSTSKHNLLIMALFSWVRQLWRPLESDRSLLKKTTTHIIVWCIILSQRYTI